LQNGTDKRKGAHDDQNAFAKAGAKATQRMNTANPQQAYLPHLRTFGVQLRAEWWLDIAPGTLF